ncbi:MAG: hypothetical protein DMF51_10270 [Acidobacteria bacterium]|nr:MAG: hypothetical protein DMF51_10270 [Acidobacteriota bacterium]
MTPDTLRRPRLTIVYCTRCRWLLRAAGMAQELLITFEADGSAPRFAGPFDRAASRSRATAHSLQGSWPQTPRSWRCPAGRGRRRSRRPWS